MEEVGTPHSLCRFRSEECKSVGPSLSQSLSVSLSLSLSLCQSIESWGSLLNGRRKGQNPSRSICSLCSRMYDTAQKTLIACSQVVGGRRKTRLVLCRIIKIRNCESQFLVNSLYDSFGQPFRNRFQKKGQKQSRNRNCDSFGIGVDTALNKTEFVSRKIGGGGIGSWGQRQFIERGSSFVAHAAASGGLVAVADLICGP